MAFLIGQKSLGAKILNPSPPFTRLSAWREGGNQYFSRIIQHFLTISPNKLLIFFFNSMFHKKDTFYSSFLFKIGQLSKAEIVPDFYNNQFFNIQLHARDDVFLLQRQRGSDPAVYKTLDAASNAVRKIGFKSFTVNFPLCVVN